MRPSLTIFGVAALVALSLNTAAESRPSKQYSIEELLDTENIFGSSFSPDGSKILVTSDRTGILNAFALPVDGGRPIQLTHSTTESVFARSYFPRDERFIYESDQGGNELNHVYVRAPDGSATDVTPGEGLKASFFRWADDEQSFFVVTNERDPKYFDLYEVDLRSYEKTLIYENNAGYMVSAISPNKRYIALSKVNTRADSDLYLHDRETGETRVFMDPDEPALCIAEEFTKDGSALYVLTDAGREFRYLIAKDLASGRETVLEQLDWDISYARRSRASGYLVIGINRDARSEVRVYDLDDGSRVPLPDMGDEDIAQVSMPRTEDAIGFYVQGGRTPGDLYYYRPDTMQQPRRLTRRLSEKVDPEDLVEPEIVRFSSYDGVTIPGVLYKPHQASAANEVPALVYVHGGPGGQTRATYNPLIQYLVNHGYAVYGINNRGSSGYGKTFYAMDDQNHGDADLDDCVASKGMLAETGWVDADRIGIIGGSYGGYMVCAAMAFRPEAFDVGVDIFGVTNWVRTLKSIPAWWEASRNSLYQELGNPFEQEDYLHKISPLFHAENIRKPMIVLQGANDPRVLKVESDEMVEAIRANDVPVEYVVFEDEGHGFRKKANQIVGYKAILAFLDDYLAEPQ